MAKGNSLEAFTERLLMIRCAKLQSMEELIREALGVGIPVVVVAVTSNEDFVARTFFSLRHISPCEGIRIVTKDNNDKKALVIHVHDLT